MKPRTLGVAYRLGDDTAARQGRLSLNPLRHLDPFGTIVLIATQAFGWAKPVPVAPWRLRYGPRVGHALVAAAGPLSNLLIGDDSGGGVAIGSAEAACRARRSSSSSCLSRSTSALFLFNLIPLGPLDGFSVLSGIVDAGTARKIEPLYTYGTYILMGLFMLSYVSPRLNILGLVLSQGMSGLTRLLLGL